MITSPNMGLKIYNLTTDPWVTAEVAGNMAKIDAHDHTPGKGLPITTAAIADGAVTGPKLAPGAIVPPSSSITTAMLQNGSVTNPKLATSAVSPDKLDSHLLAQLGVNTSLGFVGRGTKIVNTSETMSQSVSYLTMTTPDTVTGVTLPAGGLLFVAYLALAKSAVGQSFASVLVNGVQPSAYTINSTNVSGGGGTILTSTFFGPLTSTDLGFTHYASTASDTDDNTGGPLLISAFSTTPGTASGGFMTFGALTAGTYDISVGFVQSVGATLTLKKRRLYVWTSGFAP